MHVKALKTHPIHVGSSLFDLLDRYVSPLQEKTILAITSKIISLCQGRVVDKNIISHKGDLIKQEAQGFLEEENNPFHISLTITNNILIPSAGIDESNGNGFYILYPKDIQKTATLIWQHLRQRDQLDTLGVIITDSHTTPLRRGVTGIALGWCGFEPLYNYIDRPDIFGNKLRMTQINLLDALATSAVFIMGEGAEQTPFALITKAPKIQFTSYPPTLEDEKNVKIPLDQDIYAPLLESVKWVWNTKKE